MVLPKGPSQDGIQQESWLKKIVVKRAKLGKVKWHGMCHEKCQTIKQIKAHHVSQSRAHAIFEIEVRLRKTCPPIYFTEFAYNMTRWPSGLRRQLKALVRKSAGSNPVLVSFLNILLTSESIHPRAGQKQGPTSDFLLQVPAVCRKLLLSQNNSN